MPNFRFKTALILTVWFMAARMPAAVPPTPAQTNGVDQYDLQLRVRQTNTPAQAPLQPEQPIAQAAIHVHPGRVLGELNPLFIGYNLEDLSHAIFPGLDAQMIYGESFEDAPDQDLPAGWQAWLEPKTSELTNHPNLLQKWRGEWAMEDGAVTLWGCRQRRIFTAQVQMTNGVVECEVSQPSTERNFWGPGLLVCWSPSAYYFVYLSPERHLVELMKGSDPAFTQSATSVASRQIPLEFDRWHSLKVRVHDGLITIWVGGQEVLNWHDPQPLSGGIGLESSFCVGRFRNLTVIPEGGQPWHADFSLKERPDTHTANISRWWDSVITGHAQARYQWDAENPYNTDRSQKLELLNGNGTVGLANTGLHNWDLTFHQGWTYQGRLYLRGDYAGTVTLALQNRDGTKTLATQKLHGVGKAWRKFDIQLQASSDETNGRFALWIDQPGRLWVDQVILRPGQQGLYQDLPVRRDLAEKLVAGIGHLRFGGDMINTWQFDWKKMLRPPDQRRQYLDGWNYHKSAQFMIFEFLDFCRAAGVEPIINFGEHTPPQEIAEFVEYCNGDNATEWGRRRIASGRRAPYHLKYVMYGNALPPPENLAQLAAILHAQWPGVKLITGDVGHETWTNIGQRDPQFARAIDGLSGQVEALGSRPEVDCLGSYLNWINNLALTRASFPAFAGRQRPFLYAEEVNSHHHNWQRGLSDALFEISSERQAGTVWANCFCTALQASGNLYEWDEGHIQFNSGSSWYEPCGWVVRLLGENFQPVVLETEVDGPLVNLTQRTETNYIQTAAAALVASATRDRAGHTLVLKVVNLRDGCVDAALDLDSLRVASLEVFSMASRDLNGVNTASLPDNIAPKHLSFSHPAAQMRYTFPPDSLTILKYTTK